MAFFAGSKHGDLTQHWDEIPNLEIIYIYTYQFIIVGDLAKWAYFTLDIAIIYEYPI